MPEEKTLASLADDVESTTTEIKGLLSKQQEEIKTHGKSTQETADSLTEQEKRLEQLGDDFKGFRAQLESAGDLGELVKLVGAHKDRLDELEKLTKRPRWEPNEDELKELKTPGERFLEMLQANDGAELKRLEGAVERNSEKIALASVDPRHWPQIRGGSSKLEMALKALTTGTFFGGGSGDVILPERMPLMGAVERPLVIRDLMAVSPTDRTTIEYVEEIGFSAAGVTVSVSGITRSGSTATATTATAHGFETGEIVRIAGATQTEYNGDHRITVASSTTFTYAVSGSPTTPATGTITAKQLQTHGAAAPTAEGSAKPEAELEYALREASVRTIPHWLPASRQILQDLPGLRSLIDNRLLYGVGRAEERQLLYGTGSGQQLQGILTHPRRQTRNWSDGASGDTRLDAFRRSYTDSQRADYVPTGAVMHPYQWQEVELTKGDDKHYIWVTVTDGGPARLWRVPVVVTNAINETDCVLGGFEQGSQLRDREEANIRFSEHHSTYFTENMVAILAEERVAAVWLRPESFVHLNFDAAP